jgi:hypothetical protein
MHRPLEMKCFYFYRENVTIGGNENLYMIGPPWRTQDEPNDERQSNATNSHTLQFFG